jgi:type VI secretion system secreted protein VgrG
VAGKSVDVSAVKRFTVAAGELVSLFAQKLGIRLFAARGPVEIQAQSDAMSLLADRDVTVASVDGKVDIAASKELILACGGAFVKLADGNITLGGPGDLFLKIITVQKQGAQSYDVPMNLNHPGLAGLPTMLLTLHAMASPASRGGIPTGMPYKLFADGELMKQGVFDSTGQLLVDHHMTTRKYTLELANGVTHTLPVAEAYRGDTVNGTLANRGFQYHEAMPEGNAEAVDRAMHRQSYSDLLSSGSED